MFNLVSFFLLLKKEWEELVEIEIKFLLEEPPKVKHLFFTFQIDFTIIFLSKPHKVIISTKQ